MSSPANVHSPRLTWRLEVTLEQHLDGGLARLAAVVLHRDDYVITKAVEIFHPPVDLGVLEQFTQAVSDSIERAVAATIGIQAVVMVLE